MHIRSASHKNNEISLVFTSFTKINKKRRKKKADKTGNMCDRLIIQITTDSESDLKLNPGDEKKRWKKHGF